MKKQLFPQTFINASIEHYTFRLRKRLVSIYSILLFSIITALALLPFISVKVSTSMAGLIGTEENRYDLNTSVGSFVVQNRLEEGLKVKKGDTLLVLKNTVLQKELTQTNSRIYELEQFVTDLNMLIKNTKSPPQQF